MKYIKLFEKKVLDDILDKISSGENPTDWEKKYLNVYGTPEADEMEEELKPELPAAFRNDESEVDEEIDDNRVVDMWDELDGEDMLEFMSQYKIVPEFSNKPWHKLPDTVKEKFSLYLQQKGFI